jgi:hypothetical protein
VARAAFEADAAAVDAALRRVAADPRIREAVTWQNRHALRTGFDPYLRDRGGKPARAHALLVCRYLQRYCAKNETIGFFGPMAWGRIVDSGPALQVRHGACELRRRHIVFEHWALHALAAAWADEGGLQRWLAPRLSPLFRLESGALVHADGRHTVPPPAVAVLLALLDGERGIDELAARLAGDTGAAGAARLEPLLVDLARRGVVVWQPALSPVSDGIESLRRALSRVGDDALRARLQGTLAELVDARERVAAAAGDPVRVGDALDALDRRFEAAASTAPTRLAGRAYAGRTMLYEDCERDLDLELGPGFVDAIARPLALVLDSVRWLTHCAATRYMEFVADAFERCAGARGAQGTVPLARLWQLIQTEAHVHELIVDDIVGELQAHWWRIAGEPAGRAPVQLDAAQIAHAVAQAFAAPAPGWPSACVHSPDLMPCARTPQEFEHGGGLVVLGEVHAAVATVLQPTFAELAPGDDVLRAHVDADLDVAEITAVPVLHGLGRRAVYDPPSARGVHIEFDHNRSWRPREQVVAIAQMVVVRDGDRLLVRSLDGRHAFPAIAFFGPQLRGFCLRKFSPFARRAHLPRILIDRLVIAREQWLMVPHEVNFAHLSGAFERFAAAGRWAQQHGLPRRLFARSSRGEKPLYVDLHSPPLVDLLAKRVRDLDGEQQPWLALSEMLPDPDGCWLRDRDGRRLSSEIRLTAVDTRPWREAAIPWPAS